MTPNERDTLDAILSHVGAFNHRVVDGARIDHIKLLAKNGEPRVGDIVIECVRFRPTRERCA